MVCCFARCPLATLSQAPNLVFLHQLPVSFVEQDHRFIKKITKPMFGFKSFLTAEQTLKGIEAIHMIKKGQAENHSSVISAVEWLNKIFGIVAKLITL
jgi:hypothetical protein